MILYNVAKLLLEFTSFAVLDFFCGLVLPNSWEGRWFFRLKT